MSIGLQIVVPVGSNPQVQHCVDTLLECLRYAGVLSNVFKANSDAGAQTTFVLHPPTGVTAIFRLQLWTYDGTGVLVEAETVVEYEDSDENDADEVYGPFEG